MICHARAVLASGLAWVHACAWLWPHAAAAETLRQDMQGYDWHSLLYAAALGLLGGGLALIVALASDARVVRQVVGESLRSALVSPIAGAVCYLGLEALAALDVYHARAGLRFLIIVAAGWAGTGFFDWARELARRLALLVGEHIIARARKPGGPPP